MKFLTNGLSGREPLLIDPAKAKDHAVLAEKFGFTDMLAQLFGVAPKPYVTADGIGVIPVVGVIGKGLTPIEKMMGASDVDELSAAIDAFAMNPDVVIIATGGIAQKDILTAGNELTVSAWDILSGDVKPGQNVLLYDDAGDHTALQAALRSGQVGFAGLDANPFCPPVGASAIQQRLFQR